MTSTDKKLPPDPMPCVYRDRAACPACASTTLKVNRTMPAEGDGSQTRYMRCLKCGATFKLIEEPTEPE